MDLTPEQTQIGKNNFYEAVGSEITRRDLMKASLAVAGGLGALYFNYEKLNGSPIKCAFIGCGDEGNVIFGASS